MKKKRGKPKSSIGWEIFKFMVEDSYDLNISECVQKSISYSAHLLNALDGKFGGSHQHWGMWLYAMVRYHHYKKLERDADLSIAQRMLCESLRVTMVLHRIDRGSWESETKSICWLLECLSSLRRPDKPPGPLEHMAYKWINHAESKGWASP